MNLLIGMAGIVSGFALLTVGFGAAAWFSRDPEINNNNRADYVIGCMLYYPWRLTLMVILVTVVASRLL